MSLSKESIKEFKRIYKQKFGEEISDQDAYKQGTKLVNLIKIIYKPKKRNIPSNTESGR